MIGITSKLSASTSIDRNAADFDSNQIRGINSSGSTGYGIPAQVTNVTASMANATAGSTSTVTVMFRRDPSDRAFDGAVVYLKGYQGNQTPTQIASSTDSPINFILTNTGEAVSILVQAFGNGGYAPLAGAPTFGIRLPLASAGGVGTTTTTTTQIGSGTAGRLAKWASSSTLTNANLSGDATTNNDVVTTVVALQGSAINTVVPFQTQALVYAPDAAASWTAYLRGATAGIDTYGIVPDGTGNLTGAISSTIGTSLFATWNVGTPGAGAGPIACTSSARPGVLLTTPVTSSTTPACVCPGNTSNTGICFGLCRILRLQIKLGQTTNMRIWAGLGSLTGSGQTVYSADAPNLSFSGFRFSTTTETQWQCVTQNSNVNQTVNTSGQTPDSTNVHVYEIHVLGSTTTFFMDGTQVGSQSGTPPAAGTLMYPVIYLDNKSTNNGQTFSFHGLVGSMRGLL